MTWLDCPHSRNRSNYLPPSAVDATFDNVLRSFVTWHFVGSRQFPNGRNSARAGRNTVTSGAHVCPRFSVVPLPGSHVFPAARPRAEETLRSDGRRAQTGRREPCAGRGEDRTIRGRIANGAQPGLSGTRAAPAAIA